MANENFQQILNELQVTIKEINISELLKHIRRHLTVLTLSEDLKRKIYAFCSVPDVLKLIEKGEFNRVEEILKRRLNFSENDLKSLLDIINIIKEEYKEALLKKTEEATNPFFIFNFHGGRILTPEEYKIAIELSGVHGDNESLVDQLVSTYEKYLEALKYSKSDEAEKLLELFPKIDFKTIPKDIVSLYLYIVAGYPKILYEICFYKSVENVDKICDTLYGILFERHLRPSGEKEPKESEIIRKIERALALHYYFKKDYPKSLAILKYLEYIEENLPSKDYNRLAVLYNLYAHIFSELSDLNELRKYLEKLENIVGLVSSPYIRVAVHNSLGNYYSQLGDVDKAIRLYGTGFKIAKRYNIEFYADMIPHNLGIIKFYQGYYEEAEKLLEEVLENRKKKGATKYLIAFVARNLSELNIDRGDCQKAKKYLEEMESFKDEFADISLQVLSINTHAKYYLRCENNPQKAIELLESITRDENFLKIKRLDLKTSLALTLAEAYYRLGDTKKALGYASLAYSYLKAYEDLWLRFEVSTMLAILYLKMAQEEGNPIYFDVAQEIIENEVKQLKNKLGIIRNPLYEEFEKVISQKQ